jgi:hypothetical protein
MFSCKQRTPKISLQCLESTLRSSRKGICSVYRMACALIFFLLVSELSPVASYASVAGDQARSGNVLQNQFIEVKIAMDGTHLGALRIVNRQTGRTQVIPEAFSITLKGDRVLRASDMRVIQPLSFESLRGDSNASRDSEREAGKQSCTELTASDVSLHVRWCGILRNGSTYFRQELKLQTNETALAITEVRLLDISDPDARVSGTVKGSPVTDSTMFFAFEHPLSTSEVENGHLVAALSRDLPLRKDETISYSSVIGLAPAGQMRRAFLGYLERERAHPYRPFLHYNSWYDIGYGDEKHGARYDNLEALDRIRAIGMELVEKRHVEVDSFLFDDGWDDTSSVWKFNSGFPDGFTAERQAAALYKAGIGVWLSPWGGYDKEKGERVAAGRKDGYEVANNGLALSGSKYYQRFESVCLEMVKKYGVNFFKFDGTGNANQVFSGSQFDSDFDAAINLIRRLRKEKSNLFVNVTTGTQASPFWLLYADSIWRGGEDHSFAGVGTSRQRWITYRDAQTYANIVKKGPLYPLNSLMLHGIVYARDAIDLNTDPKHDFEAEVHSYFGSGTQLQEMYITPSFLSTSDWDILAETAIWARRNAPILKDTHWIGEDPGRLQVYGWASWSADSHKGIIVLRNPSDKAQEFSLDVQNAFELPANAPRVYTATVPWKSSTAKPVSFVAGKAVQIRLEPFEVRTLDALSH